MASMALSITSGSQPIASLGRDADGDASSRGLVSAAMDARYQSRCDRSLGCGEELLLTAFDEILQKNSFFRYAPGLHGRADA